MFSQFWSRRTFLKASLAGAFALFGGRAFAKELIMPALPARGGPGRPEGKLSLYNVHTDERLKVTYRDPWGAYDPWALSDLNYILRCHYTREVKEMDIDVIEFLNAVDKGLGGGNEIHIISGYRSPEYNDLLRREGRGVVKNSMHLSGKAIDISIPRVDLDALRKTAVSLGYGGVGYYPKSGFVHIDSGRFRTW